LKGGANAESAGSSFILPTFAKRRDYGGRDTKMGRANAFLHKIESQLLLSAASVQLACCWIERTLQDAHCRTHTAENSMLLDIDNTILAENITVTEEIDMIC
jgi:hypothetical protein